MSRPHRARLAASRLALRRRAGALSAWLHMPVPTLVPALVSLLRLPSMMAALRPVIDVVLSGLTVALPMLAAVGA